MLYSFVAIVSDHSNSKIVKFMCEDGEQAIYLPSNLAFYLEKHGEVIEIVQ